MTDKELLYKTANRLSHDRLKQFLRHCGLDEVEYWEYRKRQLAQPRIAPVNKQVKAKILKKQGGCCNFCRDPLPMGSVACYDRIHGDVLCRRCTMALINVRSLVQAGITWDMMKERFRGVKDV